MDAISLPFARALSLSLSLSLSLCEVVSDHTALIVLQTLARYPRWTTKSGGSALCSRRTALPTTLRYGLQPTMLVNYAHSFPRHPV